MYALVALALLVRLPYFPLLAALLFLGMFLAGYLARAGGERAYAGVQMGLVLPMVLVVPPSDCGNMSSATNRLIGVVIAVGCSLLVSGVAAAFWGWGKPCRISRRRRSELNLVNCESA